MQPSASLPRPTFSATFPSHRDAPASPTTAARPQAGELVQQASDFVRAHWKQIGLGALALLGWRSKRMRPLLRKAAMVYALPMAKNALLARARR